MIAILLSVARTLGLKQGVCCSKTVNVRIIFSCSSLHDLTDSTTEIPEVEMQLPRVAGNTAHVCTTVCRGVRKWLTTLPSHPAGFLSQQRLCNTQGKSVCVNSCSCSTQGKSLCMYGMICDELNLRC